VQSALDYVITCLRPIAVTFEQAIQRDLILAKDTYIVEYKLEALMRGDFEQQSNFVEKLIRNRVMRPGSEARLLFGLNKQLGCTLVLVTHDADLVAALADSEYRLGPQ